MSVQELSDLLKLHGWYLDMIRRYKTCYAYAKRRVGGKVRTRYLKSGNKLEGLSPEFVLERISEVQNTPGDVAAPPGANPAEL